MRRDSIFYQLFRQSPALLFELLPQPPARAQEYIFEAIEIIDLISTIMVYKFSNLSRDEVDAMLGIELEQTRVYLDAKAEGERVGEVRGEVKEAQSLIFRLLNRRVGKVSIEVETRIKSLPLARLEELHDAALDFTQIGDLTSWLDGNG
jgi:predicted transposase YdaD